MKHLTTAQFWELYQRLSPEVQQLADKNFDLLKADSHHPSLHFKKIGKLWSARVGIRYRVLGLYKGDTVLWFWIGSHADYDKLLS